MNVIKKLNEMRLERNLSVYRLAELSGLNQSTLANTFSRGTVPSIQNLELMCNAMGVTLSQFFTEDEKQENLTQAELNLLTDFRKLPKEIQQNAEELIKSISKNI